MPYDANLEAGALAGAEVKGAALPTPVLEKQITMEKGGFVSDDDDTLDLVIPNEEERHTLKRVPGVLPWIAFTVAFVELCERFSYYGTASICTAAFPSTGPLTIHTTC